MKIQNKKYRALRELLYHAQGEVFETDGWGKYCCLNGDRTQIYTTFHIDHLLQKGWIEEVTTPLVDQDGRFVEKPYNEDFWHICSDNYDIVCDEWVETDSDKFLYYSGNCYISKEAAEKALERQKLDAEIKRWIAKNDPEALKLGWSNYFIEIKNVYYNFSCGDKKNQCLKDIGEERVKSLFVGV